MNEPISRLPYPGLRAFEHDEADFFFGRDGAVDQMIDKLAETRFLAVLGSSGSGKSSLVRTGLLDGLELGLHPAGSDWALCVFTPGGAPFSNLAAELLKIQDDAGASSADATVRQELLAAMLRQGPRSLVEWCVEGNLPAGQNLLLLVDQFEELFRFGGYADREEAEAFVRLLIESCNSEEASIHVVMTMRSEFLGACALIPGLAEIINRGTYLTPRMTRQQCREAVVGPTRLVGGQIEDALVNRLLNDMISFAPWDSESGTDRLKSMARRADQLPLMQHVLNRLWRMSAETGCLTLDGYLGLGGLDGALDAHGNELLSQFTDDEKSVVAAIFCNLVDGYSTETATRRPMRLADLVASTSADSETVVKILNVFRSDDCSFLRPGSRVTLHDDTIVDISHESLIRQWSQLREWVAEENRAASFWRRLSSANSRYRAGEGGLLVGLDLANLGSWWHRTQPTRAWASRYSDDYDSVADFLRESEENANREEAATLERQRRQRRFLLGSLGAVSSLAIMASAAAWWGYDQQRTAKEVTVVAAGAAEDLALGLFNRMDQGLKVPVTTLHALILDREDALERMAAKVENDREIAKRRIELLIRSAQTLLDAQWIDEAASRADRLEALTLDQNNEIASDEQRLSALMIKADVLFHQAQFDAAETYYRRAEALLKEGEAGTAAISDPTQWHTRARILDRRYSLASNGVQVEEILSFAQEINDLAANMRSSHPELPPLGDPKVGPIDPDLKAAFADVLEVRILTTLDAMSGAYDALEYFDSGVLNADDMLRELKAEYQLFESLVPETSDKRRIVRVEYLNGTSQFSRRVQNEATAAMEESHEAVELAEAMLAEDRENNRLTRLLISALYERGQSALETSELSQASLDRSALSSLVLAWRQRDRSTQAMQMRAGMGVDWLKFRIDKARENDDMSQSAAKLWRTYELATEAPQDTQKIFIGFLSPGLPWLVLHPELETGRTNDDLLALINWSLETLNLDGQSRTSEIHRLINRGYIYLKLAENNADSIGADHWTRLMQQGLAEAKRLQELSPHSSMARTILEYGTGSLAMRGALEPDEKRAAFLKTVEMINEFVQVPGDHTTFVRNGAVYSREAIELVEDKRDVHTVLDTVDRFLSTVMTNPEHREAFQNSTSHLSEISTEAQKSMERIVERETTGAEEHVARLNRLVETIDSYIEVIQSESEIAQASPSTRSQLSLTTLDQNPDLRSIAPLSHRNDGTSRLNWTYGTAYPAHWRTLDRGETKALFTQHTGLHQAAHADENETFFVREAVLPFYQYGRLIEIETIREDAKRLLSFLVFPDQIFSLNGTSPAIHEANARMGVSIDSAADAAAYLRFFCLFVNGEEGAFMVVETLEEMQWSADAKSEEITDAAPLLRPLTVWPDPEKPDHWRAAATIQYSNAIFYADFRIQPTGMVEMLDDNPVAADLPLKNFSISSLRSGSTVRAQLDKIDIAPLGMKTVTSFDSEIKALKSKALETQEANVLAALEWHLTLMKDKSLLQTHKFDARKINNFAYELVREDIATENATALLETAYEDNGDDFHLGGTLGLGYLRLDRFEEAVSVLEHATSLEEEKTARPIARSEVWAVLASAYRQAGRMNDAERALTIAEGIESDKYWAKFISEERALLNEAQ